MVGDIYLAKIFFTDSQSFKLRPILIIKQNSFGDYIYIPFTTNPNNKNSIKFDSSFLSSGEFRKVSYLIVDKTCTIQSKLLDKKIATLKQNILAKMIFEYCKFLKGKR
ncbi:MAG: type II toxin-antitoxin system PemK/MazF family toxin [Campylobacterota bacterium]|nr:type II toxin-antitoxin system PemK/MazF family toxin [Campylobacterota bacterium]